MNRPLPDNGIPVKKGDLSFIYKGVYHPIVWYGEEPYRPRVETLVIKDGRYVYLNMYDLETAVNNERLGSYEVPGGSIDNDCDKITQAENEVNEEILVKVKNIYHTGVQYYEPFSDGNVELFKKESPLSYRGFMTEVYAAEYAGKFDVKKVEEKDLDPAMQKGKFYAITLIADKLTEPHINALLNCQFLDVNVKLALQLQVRNKDVTIEATTSTMKREPITEAIVENIPVHEAMTKDTDYVYVVSMRYRSLFANIVRGATKSNYNHSAISLDHSLSQMYTYTRDRTNTPHPTPHGFAIESIDFMVNNRDRDTYAKVVAIPVNKDKLEALRLKLDRLTKFNSSNYDFGNVIRILFGIKTTANKEDSYVCSTFVASCLQYLGIKLPKDTSLMTPEDISNIRPDGVVYEGLLRKYDYKKIVNRKDSLKLRVETKETKNPNDSVSQKAVELLFYDGTTKVGRVCISAVDTDKGFVYDLEVDKKYRGKGYGRHIMEYVLNNYRVRDLTVEPTNTVAINLYKSLGFTITKKTSDPVDNKAVYLMQYNNEITESTKRSELPDEEFGIPEERKYPLDTEEHVRSAIKLFNHVDRKYEAELAKRILQKKSEYGIDDITIGEKNRLSKYITESTHYTMYHLSPRNLNNKTLKPKIPNNFMTRNGYEDDKTARVCMAPSIDQALTAISSNLTNHELYVHVPIKSGLKIKHPSTDEVPDVNVTGEIWVMEDVTLVCIGKIKVVDSIGKGIPYKYGENNTAELYRWKWKWTESFSVTESFSPVLEAPGDDDPDEATDYTTDAGDDGEPDTTTDYTTDAGDDDTTTEPDEATDYTTDADDSDTSDNTDNTDTTDDTDDSSMDDSMDDDVTDYTDDLGDDDVPTDDEDTSSDDTDTSTDEPQNDTTDKNSIVKNYNLILDFQSLYRYLDQIATGLESTVFKSPIQNSALTQIVNNMRRLKNTVANYIEFNFGNDYVTNLYNYNIFVKALKINLEMLSITKDLHTDESTNT